ncbi:hypothetical protein FACS1894159_09060 [Bacteroidia bacterium]|nr:hypothetical protein FACS1894159_09060 [Bacteroidia bacterium]
MVAGVISICSLIDDKRLAVGARLGKYDQLAIIKFTAAELDYLRMAAIVLAEQCPRRILKYLHDGGE